MEKIAERLKTFRDYKCLNDSELAKELGYKSSEKISRLFRGEGAKPSADMIEDIANKFEELNLEWWFTGKGGMIKSEVQPTTTTDNKTEKSEDYQTKYIALLEEHLDVKKALERELSEFRKEYSEFRQLMLANLKEYQEDAAARLAYLKTVLRSQTLHRAKTEKVSVEKLNDEIDTILIEETDHILKIGK